MPEVKDKIILGEKFPISMPYSEGHTCTAAEAKALNQVRAENIGNNQRLAVKEAQGDLAKMQEVRDRIAEYDRTYIFTIAAVGAARKTLDPVEREARAIAKAVLKDKLTAKGKKLTLPKDASDAEREEWDTFIEEKIQILLSNDKILQAAKKRVKERQSLTDGLDLGDGDEAAAA